jgi:hypothetical protein
VFAIQQRAQALPDNRVIVNEHDRDGSPGVRLRPAGSYPRHRYRIPWLTCRRRESPMAGSH